MNLRNINLNLLLSLDFLLTEKNVTRAAKKAFLSQGAMSVNLKELRKIFKNQLLIREKSKLVLTPYAQQLQPRLRRMLEELDGLIQNGHFFQPEVSRRTFKVGMSDLWASLILPDLMPVLKKEAPNIILNIIPMTQMYAMEPFEREEYDMAIARASDTWKPTMIFKKLLLKDGGICILNPRHPLAKKKKITVSEYLSYKHAVWRTDNPEFPSVINQFLEKNGEKPRDAALYLVYIDALFRLIEKSDELIGSTFSIAAALIGRKHNCVVKPLPFENMPGIETYIAWHAKFNDDAAHQWLRNKIITVAEKILKKHKVLS